MDDAKSRADQIAEYLRFLEERRKTLETARANLQNMRPAIDQLGGETDVALKTVAAMASLTLLIAEQLNMVEDRLINTEIAVIQLSNRVDSIPGDAVGNT